MPTNRVAWRHAQELAALGYAKDPAHDATKPRRAQAYHEAPVKELGPNYNLGDKRGDAYLKKAAQAKPKRKTGKRWGERK